MRCGCGYILEYAFIVNSKGEKLFIIYCDFCGFKETYKKIESNHLWNE